MTSKTPEFIEEFFEEIGEESDERFGFPEDRDRDILSEWMYTIDSNEQIPEHLADFQMDILRQARNTGKEDFEEEEAEALVAAATMVWVLMYTDDVPMKELRRCEEALTDLSETAP